MLRNAKKAVDLAAPVVRVSRIRRDPPPAPLREMSITERDERNRRTVVIGVVAFALAIAIITIGFASIAGWSPSQYTIHIGE